MLLTSMAFDLCQLYGMWAPGDDGIAKDLPEATILPDIISIGGHLVDVVA